jgi:O-antigen/teichoic acid export membrane protein
MNFQKSRTRTTKWNLFFHYYVILYSILSGIILVPLYLKSIPINIYGAWLGISNILGWLTIVDPGLSTIIMQKISNNFHNNKDEDISSFITNGIFLSICFAIIIMLIGLIISINLFHIINIHNIEYEFVLKKCFSISVITCSLMIISYCIIAINQGLQSSLGVGIIHFFSSSICLLTMILLLKSGFGIISLPISLLFQSILLLIGNLSYLIYRIKSLKVKFKITFNGLRGIVNLMTYTFAGKAMGGISNNIDAFIVTRFLGPASTPILVLSRKGIDIIRTFLENTILAFIPAIANLHGDSNRKRTKEILLRLLMIFNWTLGLAVIGLIKLNHIFVDLWVGQKIFIGAQINYLLIFGFVVIVFTKVLSNLCYALGNIKGNSIILLVENCLSIPLMYLCGKYFGMIGVVLPPIITTLFISIWYYPKTFSKIIEIKINELKYLSNEIIYTIFSIFSAFIIYNFINLPISSWIEFVLNALLLTIIYIITLYLCSKNFRIELRILYKLSISKLKNENQ